MHSHFSNKLRIDLVQFPDHLLVLSLHRLLVAPFHLSVGVSCRTRNNVDMWTTATDMQRGPLAGWPGAP